MKQTKNQTAFTLIEMLTVLVILAFLAQYLVSVSMQARERAYRTTCTSNIRQLLQACQMYETDYGELPLDCPGVWCGVDYGDRRWQDATFPYVRNRDIYICPVDPDRGRNPVRTHGGMAVSYTYLPNCVWMNAAGRLRPPSTLSPILVDGNQGHFNARVFVIGRYDGSVEVAPFGRYESIRYEPEDGQGPSRCR